MSKTPLGKKMKFVVYPDSEVSSVFFEISSQAMLIIFVFLSGILVRACSTQMDYFYLRTIQDFYTGLMKSVGEIQIFKIHKEVFII